MHYNFIVDIDRVRLCNFFLESVDILFLEFFVFASRSYLHLFKEYQSLMKVTIVNYSADYLCVSLLFFFSTKWY